jgi:uncharacterized protein (TIGR02588 family)
MRRNWLERAILVVSVVTIALLVGYLAIDAATGGEQADIAVTAHREEAQTTTVGWEVPVTVRNAGRSPASALTIEASARVAGEEETSDLVLDLLPAGSEVELVAGFSAEPDGEIAFRVIGYESP